MNLRIHSVKYCVLKNNFASSIDITLLLFRQSVCESYHFAKFQDLIFVVEHFISNKISYLPYKSHNLYKHSIGDVNTKCTIYTTTCYALIFMVRMWEITKPFLYLQ